MKTSEHKIAPTITHTTARKRGGGYYFMLAYIIEEALRLDAADLSNFEPQKRTKILHDARTKNQSNIDPKMKRRWGWLLASIFHGFSSTLGGKLEASWHYLYYSRAILSPGRTG